MRNEGGCEDVVILGRFRPQSSFRLRLFLIIRKIASKIATSANEPPAPIPAAAPGLNWIPLSTEPFPDESAGKLIWPLVSVSADATATHHIRVNRFPISEYDYGTFFIGGIGRAFGAHDHQRIRFKNDAISADDLELVKVLTGLKVGA